MSRIYELTFIVRVDPSEEVMNQTVEQVKTWVEEDGSSKVTNIDRWGRRKLAYLINKQREGYYVLMHFDGTPQILPELERNLKLSDKVLRYLIIRPEEKVRDKKKKSEKSE